MRNALRMRWLIVAFALFASVAASVSLAQQVHPIDRPPVHTPGDPLPERSMLPMPTMRPIGAPHPGTSAKPGSTPAPGASPRAGGRFHDIALQSRLGPKVPLASLPMLPKQTKQNTLYPSGGGRKTMSATPASIWFSEVSGCSSSIGVVFNVGCQIQFQLAYCNPYNSGNCFGAFTITPSDTFQDYYVDANSATAQTIGSTYVPGYYSDYGPSHNLTLNNAGTVVLASYDKTKGVWVAVVYITVGSANGLNTFSDSGRSVPQTEFSIPGSGTTPVYITLNSAQYSDLYAFYIENTSIYANCAMVIPGGTSSTGLCNPNSVTGIKALASGDMYTQWDIPSTMTAGTYSIVAYDQTLGKRVAQTQIALTSSSGGAMTFSPISGNSSPNPAPASTPGTRFAFDDTTDQSDKGVNMNASGLNINHYVCFSISDPDGRVYQDYTNNNLSFICGYPSGGSISVADTFLNYKSPYNFAPNTYTVGVYDYNSGTIVSEGSFQLLGYNAITDFTNAAGTSITGTSLVLPKNSSSLAGLEFLNDGDSYYGTGNGDTLSGFYYSSGSNGITIQLSCYPCTSQTVTDSAGNSWTVKATATGSGNSAGTTLTITPVSTSTKLAVGADIVVPNLTFVSGPGSSTCTTGCTAPTSILPTDGLTWSKSGVSESTNLTYFTNGNGNTYAGTASFVHEGIVVSNGAWTGTGTGVGEEPHGFYPRMSQSLYAENEPFTQSSTKDDVYKLTVTNNGSAGSGNYKGIAIVLPTSYAPTGTKNVMSINAATSLWQQDTTCTVTGAFCIKPAGANTGIAPGTSQTIYLDVYPGPNKTFTYSEVQVSTYSPYSLSLTADPNTSFTVLVSALAPTQETVDALALAGYSIDGSLMSPYFTPTSEGVNTDNPVQLGLKNVSTSQDTNPDYIDAVVIELPNGVVDTAQPFSSMPSGWSYLNSVSPGLGGASTTDYWFGVCSSQFNTADGPTTSQPPVNGPLPACTATQEQSSIAPGGSFLVTAYIKTGSSPGTITSTTWAHGANGNGWSNSHTAALNVTTISATAGFNGAGGYPTATTVAQYTTPTVSTDTDPTYGNAFSYTIKNTSGTGQNLNGATITIPYQDASGVNGQDLNNFIWTITSTPTLSGSGWSNCGVTSYSSAVATTSNGQIVIGNSGGTCTIPSGASITVNFDMKAPYKPNDSWQFPATVSQGVTNVSAAETWTGDTYIQTQLSATLSVTVWPSTGPLGALTPTCTLPCNYNQSSNILDFGTIANLGSNTGTDVVLVDVNTNAASPTAWGVYVTTSANPANTGGTYTNEMVTDVDQAKSTSGFTTYLTSMGVVPTSGNGLTLVHTTGMNPSRTPYGIVNNYEIYINGGSTASQITTVTYTFLAQ